MGRGKAWVHGRQVGTWVPNLCLVCGEEGFGKFGTTLQGRILKGKKGPEEGPAHKILQATSLSGREGEASPPQKAPLADRES